MRARSVAPGEPIRIVVRADTALRELGGEGVVLSGQELEWNLWGMDVYEEATVETVTDSHGVTTRTVRTPPGAKPQQPSCQVKLELQFYVRDI